MKKFKIKCLSSLCLGIMLMSLFTVSSSAHEIYYNGNEFVGYTAINLKWDETLNGKAYLKINGDALNATYSFHYPTIRSAWNNIANKVTVVQSSFSTSTVDMATASQDYWNYRWGDRYEKEMLGVCDNTTTDGYLLTNSEVAQVSSKVIKYAQIYFTPYMNEYKHDTHCRKIMVHEIGHALGLGHPNMEYYWTNAPSVMRQSTVETYYTPQQHDIDDLAAKY